VSQVTAGKIVEDLLRRGILEETDASGDDRARPGRPARGVRLDRSTPRYLIIQIGVVHTRLAVAPIAPPADDRWLVTFRTPASPAKFEAALRQAAGKLPQAELLAALMSVPGVVDEPAGKVLLSPNLHWTEEADLPQIVSRVLGLPVSMMQEIRALAMGQLCAEPESRDFLLVDFGQGVGAAAVLGGKLFQGSTALCGELGHTPVVGNARPCGCGAVGCVETLLSRRGLLESFRIDTRNPTATWEDLRAHLATGKMPGWLTRSLDAGAAAIAGALNVLGLHRVVLTGSITELPGRVGAALCDAISRGAMWARFGQIDCTLAPRRRAAGLVCEAIERLMESS
jgi:predicted NBD/HSP70 family sugar kinase